MLVMRKRRRECNPAEAISHSVMERFQPKLQCLSADHRCCIEQQQKRSLCVSLLYWLLLGPLRVTGLVCTSLVQWVVVQLGSSHLRPSYRLSYTWMMLPRCLGATVTLFAITLLISPYFHFQQFLPSHQSDYIEQKSEYLGLAFPLLSPLAGVAAESIQGLHLNSFIPHFEPLYYDRHQLLHQYTRLKRSLSQKKSRIEEHKRKGDGVENERTTARSDSIGHPQQPNVIPSVNREFPATPTASGDQSAYPEQNPSINPTTSMSAIETNDSISDWNYWANVTTVRSILSIPLAVSSVISNLSTTTTAFIRHNCPLPNWDLDYDTSLSKHRNGESDTMGDILSSDSSSFSNSKQSSKQISDEWLDIDITDDTQIDESQNDHDSGQHPSQHHMRVEFTAHNRHFKLKLQSNNQRVFAPNILIESTGRGDFYYDTGNVVQGHLEDDEEAIFEGIITQDGLLDGHLQTKNDEFYIEPASRYFSHSNSRDFHSVIYSVSTVNFPNVVHGSASPHGGAKFLPLQNPFQKVFDFDFLNDFEQVMHLNRPKRSVNSDSAKLKHDLYYHQWMFKANSSNIGQSLLNANLSNFDLRYKLPSDKSPFLSQAPANPSLSRLPSNADHFRKTVKTVSVGSGNRNMHDHGRYWRDMDSLHYTESEPYGIKAINPRTHWIDDQRHHDRHVVVDPKKTTCMLYLQADHLFFEKMGSEEACIESMTRHVQKVNNIYKNTDFDQDGRPDNISFLIKRIKVHTLEALKDPEYRYPSTYGVEKFLELFSEEDYDAFCLAYMFTYRDFEGGTLGLAWTGDLKNAGGVCEKNGHYRGSLKSLNTGIVTLLNYGKHVPPIVSHVTLAHEIGHNFGSPHDPEDDHACTPGGENGNYIMFARATSGDKRNNNKFSPCSLRSINAVLNTKAKSLKGCFQEPQDAICGNEVVEEGEECDCGWEEDCKEPCCFPMRANPPPDEQPCRLRPNVICSPSQGPCCTQDCKLKVGNKCRDDNGCRTASYCNGHGPQCPPSTNKANKTICNEEYVCYMGECTGSICMAYGLESCQCKQGPNDPPSKLCELCCRMPSDDNTCKSSFEWNISPFDVPDLYAKPGTPCDNYNGYCDVNQRCREVDPSSPLATLRRLLLSNESMASLKRWFNEQWFYVAVLILITVLILLMAYKVFNSRRSLRLTKTDIMEVALEAVAKHQQEQAQQQQQQQHESSTNNDTNSSSTANQSSSGTATLSASSTSNISSSVSTLSTVASSTPSSPSLSSSSTKTTNTTALISTPSVNASSKNANQSVPVQARNSIDSQASQDVTHNSSNSSYQFCYSANSGGQDSSYNASMANYVSTPGQKHLQQSKYSNKQMCLAGDNPSKVTNAYMGPSMVETNESSIYGTMKSSRHHSQSQLHQTVPQPPTSVAYYQHSGTSSHTPSSLLSLENNLYHHPFSATTTTTPANNSSATGNNSVYGYSGQGRQSSQLYSQTHHHHHSIPSLYQPSVLYQQQTALIPGSVQPHFDANTALAIVSNQHSSHQPSKQPSYGTGVHQGYHHLTSNESTYGQFFYPPGGTNRQQQQQLNYYPASNYYQSSSLYDYIPFPRPVNPGTVNANSSQTNPKPPIPSLSTHPSLGLTHHQAASQHPISSISTKPRSIPASADTLNLDTRRLYSSSLEVPAYKEVNNSYDIYGSNTVNSLAESKASGSSGMSAGHHHHYYYHQLYGASAGAKYAHNYGTIHRSSASAASLHHQPAHHGNSSSQRHYQHYYAQQQQQQAHNHSSQAGQSRQHHSSHPQLLNTQALTRAAAVPGSSLATDSLAFHSSSASYRRNQEIYEPLATLPLTSISHYGYTMGHNKPAHNSIYYSSRSEVFGKDTRHSMSRSNGLHHSNSFHGHLDDFDALESTATGMININSGTTDPTPSQQDSQSGCKHPKNHGSSGWV